MIKINGESFDIEEVSLKQFLEEHGYNMKRIAVECNENIVPKSQFESFILHSGDMVEVVSFVGGG